MPLSGKSLFFLGQPSQSRFFTVSLPLSLSGSAWLPLPPRPVCSMSFTLLRRSFPASFPPSVFCNLSEGGKEQDLDGSHPPWQSHLQQTTFTKMTREFMTSATHIIHNFTFFPETDAFLNLFSHSLFFYSSSSLGAF